MSKATATTRARQLRQALLDHGVRAVSIELHQGRPGTPNGRWYDTKFIAEMSHHTVSRPSQGATPCLALVKRGRSDVPGPLCNGYMGYDLIYRIICLGWANHPGAGGPLTVAGHRIPTNGARPYAFGTEFEGGLEPWTDEMHEAMARANAGILDWLGRPASAHIEHSTWTSRKIDRLNYTAASGRAALTRYLGASATPTQPEGEWDEMATQKQVQDAVRTVVREEMNAARPSFARAAALELLKWPTKVRGTTKSLHAVLSDAGDHVNAAKNTSRVLLTWPTKGHDNLHNAIVAAGNAKEFGRTVWAWATNVTGGQTTALRALASARNYAHQAATNLPEVEQPDEGQTFALTADTVDEPAEASEPQNTDNMDTEDEPTDE